MTKQGAYEWILEFQDEETLYLPDLKAAFTALYNRQPDSYDEQQGLWTLCCAAVGIDA